MDPAESILSTLDCTLDSFPASESNFGCSSDFNSGFDDNFLFNDIANDFRPDSDDLFSLFLNDQLLNSFGDFGQDGNLFNSKHTRTKGHKNTVIKNKNVNVPSVSLLKNPMEKSIRAIRPKITISAAPKVYFSQSKKNVKGTSILVKQKKSRKVSLLRKNSFTRNGSPNTVKHKNLFKESDWINHCLRDHDYCAPFRNFEKQSSANVKEEFEDILGGYCTDDVVLNELPECLSSLVGFGEQIDSEDLLDGLDQVYNYMTDQYIESLNLGELLTPDSKLPNLTEDDLNQAIQTESDNSSSASSSPFHHSSAKRARRPFFNNSIKLTAN